jgi:hypothetical protein
MVACTISNTVRAGVMASQGGAAEAQLLWEAEACWLEACSLADTHGWVLPKTAARRGCDAWSETLAASGGASFKRSITLLNELLPGLVLRLLGRVQRAPWHAPPTLRQFRSSAEVGSQFGLRPCVPCTLFLKDV